MGGQAEAVGFQGRARDVAQGEALAEQLAATASELVCYVIVPPTNISMGRFTVLSDPQGGIFTAVHWTVPTD